jgi:hypothetical protein
MRALRDWEFKVVSLYFQVSAFFCGKHGSLCESITIYPPHATLYRVTYSPVFGCILV